MFGDLGARRGRRIELVFPPFWTLLKVEAAPGLPFDNGRYEIRLESMPYDEPTISGLPMAEVLALRPTAEGAWSDDTITRRLTIRDEEIKPVRIDLRK